MKTVRQGGRFYRVCDPSWVDCCDATFSTIDGGRWNPPGTFPVLYLNANVQTAAANARHKYDGEIFGILDLNPTTRPHLQIVDVAQCVAADAISPEGLAALDLPRDFPERVDYHTCQEIAVKIHHEGHAGIASRSAALSDGRELALMKLELATKQQRISFDQWYLDRTVN